VYTNNVYMATELVLKARFFLYSNFFVKFYLNFLQFFYVKILFIFSYFINIDEIYRLLKSFNILNKIKYKEDPLLFRNYFLKIPLSFYWVFINFKNSLIKKPWLSSHFYFRYLLLAFGFQLVYKLGFYLKFFYLYDYILKKIMLTFYLKRGSFDSYIALGRVFLLLIYVLNFILINFAYLILNFFSFFSYFILYVFTKFKLKRKIFLIFLILILLKYF
jgi:hypothetical protein